MNNLLRSEILVLLFAALARPSAAQTKLTTIRVASNINDDVTPLLYAQHAGLFQKAGLDVQLTPMNSGSAVTAAVLSGSLDMGKSSLLPLISARFRKLPVSAVSPGELWLANDPISALVANKNSGLTTAKDLSGKTIAVQALRDLSEVALRGWIDENGGNSNSIRVVEVPQSAILTALKEGRVDAANMSNPGLATVLASNTVEVVGRPDDTIAKRFLLTAWFAADAYVAANPSVVKRFADVMGASAHYTNAHHAETVPLTAPFWGIDPAVLSHMPRATIGERLDPREIQPVIDIAAKYNIIARAFDAKELIAGANA
jgi:NitT/TauT family transport system substrate-binding protein